MHTHSISTHALNHLQDSTRRHLAEHRCGTYTFNDGEGLMNVVSQYVMANHPNTVPRILELGCALVYSVACMAAALSNALINTIEMDQTHILLARQNMQQLGLNERVTIHHGRFDEILVKLKRTYDAVFFDGFAPSLSLLEQMRDVLNPNGVLILANLGLASGSDLHALQYELKQTERWQKIQAIEHNSTQVLRRI